MAGTPYFSSVAARQDSVRDQLRQCIEQHDATVVGVGFIDIITRRQQCASFLARLSEIGVAAYLVTLWCDCSAESQKRFGCPHGYGGPVHNHGGYFSEMCEKDSFEITDPNLDPWRSTLQPAEVFQRCNAIVDVYKRQRQWPQ